MTRKNLETGLEMAGWSKHGLSLESLSGVDCMGVVEQMAGMMYFLSDLLHNR